MAVRLAIQHFKESRLPRKPIWLLQEAAAMRAYEHALAPDQVGGAVTADDVCAVAASELGLPADALRGGARGRARQLASRLAADLVGQDEAAALLLRGVGLSLSGLTEGGLPLAVLLLYGPRGVGKSTACVVLAEVVCGNPKALVALSMADFLETGGLNRLIGSGPGYRDWGRNLDGLLGAVRSRPSCVVTFDDVETIPADLVKPLCGMFDGQAADGMGQATDFSKCLFVLTAGPQLSVRLSQAPDAEAVTAELRRSLGNAVAGRIEEVVPFRALTRDDLRTILLRQIGAAERGTASGDQVGPVGPAGEGRTNR